MVYSLGALDCRRLAPATTLGSWARQYSGPTTSRKVLRHSCTAPQVSFPQQSPRRELRPSAIGTRLNHRKSKWQESILRHCCPLSWHLSSSSSSWSSCVIQPPCLPDSRLNVATLRSLSRLQSGILCALNYFTLPLF